MTDRVDLNTLFEGAWARHTDHGDFNRHVSWDKWAQSVAIDRDRTAEEMTHKRVGMHIINGKTVLEHLYYTFDPQGKIQSAKEVIQNGEGAFDGGDIPLLFALEELVAENPNNVGRIRTLVFNTLSLLSTPERERLAKEIITHSRHPTDEAATRRHGWSHYYRLLDRDLDCFRHFYRANRTDQELIDQSAFYQRWTYKTAATANAFFTDLPNLMSTGQWVSLFQVVSLLTYSALRHYYGAQIFHLATVISSFCRAYRSALFCLGILCSLVGPIVERITGRPGMAMDITLFGWFSKSASISFQASYGIYNALSGPIIPPLLSLKWSVCALVLGIALNVFNRILPATWMATRRNAMKLVSYFLIGAGAFLLYALYPYLLHKPTQIFLSYAVTAGALFVGFCAIFLAGKEGSEVIEDLQLRSLRDRMLIQIDEARVKLVGRIRAH